MKYIKTFEKLEYNIGDYVFIQTSDIRYPYTNIAKIYNTYDSSLYKYVVKIDDDDEKPLHVREKEVIRKLNDKELDNFLMMKNTEKYNLWNILKNLNLK